MLKTCLFNFIFLRNGRLFKKNFVLKHTWEDPQKYYGSETGYVDGIVLNKKNDLFDLDLEI